ncbi:hypothetical protein GE09DRAFT_1223016 [Coniochaeta sp. 2T2.1]|nr:hypothetical protein GE09DRAFT_1223016 [Coniochaeta sp. 2T2.1]
MKSKSKLIARPPPTKPWMLDNTSSSRLKNMEIGLPPPPAVAAYETKPLPPIPLRRSGVSRFSTEIKNALRTPTNFNYHVPPELRPDAREASIAVVLQEAHNAEAAYPVKREAKVDSGCTFTEGQGPDSHSLLPTGSVQKLLQITGAGSSASLALSNTSQTAYSHKSARKVKQVMGVDVPVDESYGSGGPAREVSPLSPESHSSSSVYSQDSDGSEARTTQVTATAVSKSFVPPSFWQASPVPASLHIVKTKARNTFGRPLAPVDESALTTNNYSHTNGAFKKDLYHASVSEMAQSTSSSSANSQTSTSSDHDENSTTSSHPDAGTVPERQPSFSNRSYQSRVRIAPPLKKLDTQSATQFNAPVKTPYPLPSSKFEFDDEDDDITPTQRDYDYDSDVSPKTAIRRPSLTSRLARRISSSFSPTQPVSELASLPPVISGATSFHPSAMPSPLYLVPPPTLRHRQIKSQDSSLRSRPTTVFSNAASTNYTAPTSRNVSPNPTSRSPTPMPGKYQPASTRTATPFPHATTTAATAATPFVPPFRTHTRNKSKSRPKPPPVPPRGPLPTPPAATSKPSLAASAFSSLSAWTAKATERIEAARQAAGILTPSERRRDKLKSSIRLEKGAKEGRMEVIPPVAVVPLGVFERAGRGKRANVENGEIERTNAHVPVRIAKGVEVYTEEKAERAVRKTEREAWI